MMGGPAGTGALGRRALLKSSIAPSPEGGLNRLVIASWIPAGAADLPWMKHCLGRCPGESRTRIAASTGRPGLRRGSVQY